MTGRLGGDFDGHAPYGGLRSPASSFATTDTYTEYSLLDPGKQVGSPGRRQSSPPSDRLCRTRAAIALCTAAGTAARARSALAEAAEAHCLNTEAAALVFSRFGSRTS